MTRRLSHTTGVKRGTNIAFTPVNGPPARTLGRTTRTLDTTTGAFSETRDVVEEGRTPTLKRRRDASPSSAQTRTPSVFLAGEGNRAKLPKRVRAR